MQVVRVVGRYAGVLFVVGISAACGIVLALAVVGTPEP